MDPKTNILNLFKPKRIAVIGASRNPKKVGRIIFENLLKSGKEVFPINPNAEEIAGRKCYKSIKELENIDLAVICVKNTLVPEILEECGENNVKASIVISAGFSEIGRKDLEDEIVKISKRYGIATLGPNCLGILYPREKLNATFMKANLIEDNYVILSQSGALGAGIIDYLSSRGRGIYAFVSVGNQAVLTVEDFVEFFSKDENVRAIGLYIEGVKDGKRFVRVLKNCEKKVFVLKAGKSKAGELAAKSHTGALLTEDIIYDFAIRQAKKKRVKNIRELLDACILSKENVGKRTVIVTNSGGPAVLLCDYLEENGLEIVRLPKNVFEELNKVLPPQWSRNNPIDVLGDATSERFEKVCEILLKNKDFYDNVIFVLTPLLMTDVEKISEVIVKFKKDSGKVVLANFIGGEIIEKAKEYLEENGIICSENGEELARILSLNV